MRTFKMVANPGAGRNKIGKYLDEIREKLTQGHIQMNLFVIGKDQDFNGFMIQDHEDTEGVIVAGGDGTINHVLDAMYHNNLTYKMAILPVGTANCFADYMGLPRSPLACLDRIIAGKTLPVDIGIVNDRCFINVLSGGLFSGVSQFVNPAMKSKLGSFSYVLAVIPKLFHIQAVPMEVTSEKRRFEGDVILCMVLNGSGVHMMNKLAPTADVGDGLLDVLIVKKCGVFSALKIAVKALFGKHVGEKKYVDYYKTDHVQIRNLSGGAVISDIDGESAPDFPLNARCLHRLVEIYI